MTDHRGPAREVRQRRELLTPQPAEALAGLLDTEVDLDDGACLPPLWHWIYLLERPRQRELGRDGHPTTGIPTPPGPGWRRMFAGGRVTTLSPLRIGEPATRRTWLHHTADKQGRSGPLRFVTVRNQIEQAGQVAIVDDYDIVYRPPTPTPGPPPPPGEPSAPPEGGPRIELDVDPVVLFRFSALTYNSHRIHYDKDYAAEEGYPDLVVHGPLQALLMGELMRRHGHAFTGREFGYRLVAPAFGTQRIVAAFEEPDGSERPAARVRDRRGRTTATGRLTPAEAAPRQGR